ncbi:MAG TPA: alpha/beta fold hydrolase [Rhizomicrobium sp.]|nr:alpha/beta fold hydrolase [Rhizomicrobium sp.]
MKVSAWLVLACAGLLGAASPAFAADYPAPAEGDWTAHDFHFHTGEVMPELRLHYTTIGAPSGEPVLILHGTAGAGGNFLNPAFAGELFGPGQPLDTRKYFIILPDALGTGKSTKPSDGLRMKFPNYDYADMNNAEYRLLTEGLGIKHLRAVIGESMGGMKTWLWAEQYPDFMDAVVPMASLPTEMSGRNWMMRRMLIDAIRSDPDWNNGDYTTQPRGLKLATVWFGIATSGGTQGDYKLAPTREQADKIVESRLAAPATGDANDTLYQWGASSDFNPAPGLEKIQAALLAINSADDERNPAELGLMEPAIKRIRNARYYLIPASSETRGHGTVGMAKLWKQQLADFLTAAPHRTVK